MNATAPSLSLLVVALLTTGGVSAYQEQADDLAPASQEPTSDGKTEAPEDDRPDPGAEPRAGAAPADDAERAGEGEAPDGEQVHADVDSAGDEAAVAPAPATEPKADPRVPPAADQANGNGAPPTPRPNAAAAVDSPSPQTPRKVDKPPTFAPAADGRTREDTRVRVIVLPLEGPNIAKSETKLLDSSLALALSKHEGLDILSSQDITNVLQVEAEKAALGCDQASCLVELAGAMDANHLVYGRVQKVGETVVMQLNLFDAERATSVSRVEARADGIEQILEELPFQTAVLVEPLTGYAAERPASWPGLFFYSSMGLLAAGGAAVVAGLGGFGAGVGLFAALEGSNEGRVAARGIAWTGLLTAGIFGPALLATGAILAGSSAVLDE